MTKISIPREELEFITDEVLITFPHVFPGNTKRNEKSGNHSYTLEAVHEPTLTWETPMVKAVRRVAEEFDKQNWQRHVFGQIGVFKRLEDMPKRNASKYPYAQGKFILNFSRVVSLAFLKMKDANLADPAQRAAFEAALAREAPRVVRFANPNDPNDIAQISAMNQELALKGLPQIPAEKIRMTLLPVASHELWSGCYGRIHGRAYWANNAMPATVCLSLEMILLTRQGERLGAAPASPDDVFGEFAPTAELAPPPVPGFIPGPAMPAIPQPQVPVAAAPSLLDLLR